MPRFKLLAGGHTEGGKTYTAGDVVNSPHPLDEMFSNKFERLAEEPPRTSLGAGDATRTRQAAKKRSENVRDMPPDSTQGLDEPEISPLKEETEAEEQDELDEEMEAGEEEPDYDDATEQFQGAAEAGYEVRFYASEGQYKIFKPGNKRQSNQEELTSKRKVKDWLAEHQK